MSERACYHRGNPSWSRWLHPYGAMAIRWREERSHPFHDTGGQLAAAQRRVAEYQIAVTKRALHRRDRCSKCSCTAPHHAPIRPFYGVSAARCHAAWHDSLHCSKRDARSIRPAHASLSTSTVQRSKCASGIPARCSKELCSYSLAKWYAHNNSNNASLNCSGDIQRQFLAAKKAYNRHSKVPMADVATDDASSASLTRSTVCSHESR